MIGVIAVGPMEAIIAQIAGPANHKIVIASPWPLILSLCFLYPRSIPALPLISLPPPCVAPAVGYLPSHLPSVPCCLFSVISLLDKDHTGGTRGDGDEHHGGGHTWRGVRNER